MLETQTLDMWIQILIKKKKLTKKTHKNTIRKPKQKKNPKQKNPTFHLFFLNET